MRVSRAQAEENRRNVINVASRLFRQHGYDGVGLNELMQGAGLTQGGFYKQFQSKEDLAVQASVKAFDNSRRHWADVVAGHARRPFDALVRFYLSAKHRKDTAQGCGFAALGSDAARRSDALRDVFTAAIRDHGAILEQAIITEQGAIAEQEVQTSAAVAMSAMVGALMLSRNIADDQEAEEFLQKVADGILQLPMKTGILHN